MPRTITTCQATLRLTAPTPVVGTDESSERVVNR